MAQPSRIEVDVVAVADCPNAALLDRRLRTVLAGRRDVRLRHRVVTDAEDAVRRRMRGSPTLLVDGVDPFPAEDQALSLACRLYRHDDGRLDGAPSVDQLRRALRERTDGSLAETVSALTAATSALGQGWLFRPLLRLLSAGRPVAVERVGEVTGRSEPVVRAALADWPDTEYDGDGRVVGFGLTLNPTPHRFRVGGVDLYAWCALDTLTFPGMLGRPAEVESPCHASGAPVRMTVDPTGGVRGLTPSTAVVSLAVPAHCSSIRGGFCDQVHFFAAAALARAWLDDRPGAVVVPVAEAYRIGPAVIDRLGDAGDAGDAGEEPG